MFNIFALYVIGVAGLESKHRTVEMTSSRYIFAKKFSQKINK